MPTDSPPDEGARVDRLALIPARGGSKGVPGKNLRLLGGVPLVVHSIRVAQASGLFTRVCVSTEDSAIAEVATGLGAVVIERPKQLAHDEARMADVVLHALGWYEHRFATVSRIFLLQPTSPLRIAEDLHAADRILDGDCDSVMAVFRPADPPQWAMRASREGLLTPLFPDIYLGRRQDLEPTYFDGPLYAIDAEAFTRAQTFLTRRTAFFVVPEERAVDVDTELDFQFAEFLLARSSRNVADCEVVS